MNADYLWRRIAGTPETTLADLRRTEWSETFEQFMRRRLCVGAFRYGRLGAENKQQWDRIPDMLRRLKLYMKNGDQELLVDVANLAMVEFVEGVHPKAHFGGSLAIHVMEVKK